MPQKAKRRPSDILAIIGFIIIGIIIIWGLIHAARLASPWFNSLFTPSTTVNTQPLPVKPTATTTMPTPVLTQPATPAKPVVTPKSTSPADLSVQIMSITADPYGNGMVQFDIANNGGSSTGVWYFEVNLPTDGGYTYFSPPQKSLAPGDHIVNTLQFSQISQSGGIVSIQVDPAGLIRESNKGNNYASQQVGFSYPPQYNY
jgi:hypothetical protein